MGRWPLLFCAVVMVTMTALIIYGLSVDGSPFRAEVLDRATAHSDGWGAAIHIDFTRSSWGPPYLEKKNVFCGFATTPAAMLIHPFTVRVLMFTGDEL